MISKKVGTGIAVTLQVLYKTIAQSYFDYCCPLWDNCSKVLKEKIQKHQSRAASTNLKNEVFNIALHVIAVLYS